MRKTYIIKRFDPSTDKMFIKNDAKQKAKYEEKLGKKLTNYEWSQYKRFTQFNINKNK